jgi:ABC-type phosphate transport system substrate-binding protein
VQDRKRKLGLRSGGALLVVTAAAAVLALAFAGSGAAGTPGGQACQTGASNSQVAGGGATLQTRAQVAWIQGYTADVCGFVSGGPAFTISPINSFVTYNSINDNSQTINPINGSGSGNTLTSCRMVPFSGSDTPYSNSNLTNLDGNPGAQGGGNVWWPTPATHCSGGSPNINTYLNPFYGSAGNYPTLGTDAASGDQPANVMSFPVTGTAVAVGVYFGASPPAGCPTTPQLTKQNISDLFGGIDTNWSQVFGAGCSVPVTRVVRSDNSGTSQNFKNYLKAINPSGLLCDGVKTWTAVAVDNTPNWPTGGSCSPLTQGHISGNPGVLDTCAGVNGQPQVAGSICYADLPDFESSTYQNVANFDTAELQAGASGAFVDPLIGHHANCDFNVITTPGPDQNGAVGLDPGDTWATDNAGGVHQNVWNKGNGWPACATTFDLVYSGLSQISTAATQPNRALSDNQRRGLYSYMLYVLNEGQALTPAIFYQSLPQGLLNLEISGFKANY